MSTSCRWYGADVTAQRYRAHMNQRTTDTPASDPANDAAVVAAPGSALPVSSGDPLGTAETLGLGGEPQLFVEDGLVRLSFSSIDTYLNCPAKFRYGYVFRIPSTEIAAPLIFGSAVHHALEKFHAGDLASMPEEDALRQWLREAWQAGPFAKLPDSQNNDLKRRAWNVVTAYRNRMATTWRPAAGTEVWFEVPFGPAGGNPEAMVVGSIDRLDIDPDGALHVTDYKTNKKVKSRQIVSTDLQLSIYALAVEHLFGRLPATVALDFVVPGEVVRVSVDDLDLDGAREAVLRTAREVKAEHFAPTPNPLCNWCDHKAICPAWEADDAPSLAEAEKQVRSLRREARGLLRMVTEKEAAMASLSREIAARGDVQAVDLKLQADARREQKRLQRQQEAAEAALLPSAPTGPSLLEPDPAAQQQS
ncbi:MAG: putative RecB family exonuclease [Glaciecola sp.]|jgi:putative RecB family exonuclease